MVEQLSSPTRALSVQKHVKAEQLTYNPTLILSMMLRAVALGHLESTRKSVQRCNLELRVEAHCFVYYLLPMIQRGECNFPLFLEVLKTRNHGFRRVSRLFDKNVMHVGFTG